MSDSSDPPERRAREPEDVGDGLRFNHYVEMQTKARLIDVASSLYALVETLVARGVVPIDEYERRRQVTLQRESDRHRSEAFVVLNDTPDKYALKVLPEIDCEARLPLCRARCCTFIFPLSTQDLEERVVRWNYGRPYQIGQGQDGYCVHCSGETKQCTVYEQRPATCRVYDCRNDKRIWTDFENRVAAP
jgi:Fe-S-cluster containining protein